MDFGVGTCRRRQLIGMTWQRSGVQTGCKAIVGAMYKHLERKEELNSVKANGKDESN